MNHKTLCTEKAYGKVNPSIAMRSNGPLNTSPPSGWLDNSQSVLESYLNDCDVTDRVTSDDIMQITTSHQMPVPVNHDGIDAPDLHNVADVI